MNKLFLGFAIIVLLAFTKEREKTIGLVYYYGNTQDYLIDFDSMLIHPEIQDTTYKYYDIETFKTAVEQLSYSQTTEALQDSSIIVLNGKKSYLVNYSNYTGDIIMMEFMNKDMGNFPCFDNYDDNELLEEIPDCTYFYYYNQKDNLK